MHCSVIICTYNRPKELSRLLDSIASQTRQPMEVIVVDATEGASCEENAGFVRIAAPRGLTRQRNLGLARAKGEIIAYVDDDATLTPGCLEAIERAFQEDISGKIGAITGCMLPDCEQYPTKFFNRHKLAALFGLGESDGCGKFRLSGFPSLPSGNTECKTETLIGGLMVFRREALCQIGGFDERLVTYAYMEDQDVAARTTMAGWELRYVPEASFYHLPASGGRISRRSVSAMKVVNSRYLLLKNFDRKLIRRIAWWWAMAGVFIDEVHVSGIEGALGVGQGIKRVLSGQEIL